MFRLSKNRSNAPCSFVSQCTKRDKRADAKSTLNSSSSFYSVRVENNNACNSIRFPSFLNFTSYYYTFYFPFLFLFSISLSHRCISHVYSKIRSKIRFASLLTTWFPGNQRRIKKKKKRKLFYESNFRRRKIGPIGARWVAWKVSYPPWIDDDFRNKGGGSSDGSGTFPRAGVPQRRTSDTIGPSPLHNRVARFRSSATGLGSTWRWMRRLITPAN